MAALLAAPAAKPAAPASDGSEKAAAAAASAAEAAAKAAGAAGQAAESAAKAAASAAQAAAAAAQAADRSATAADKAAGAAEKLAGSAAAPAPATAAGAPASAPAAPAAPTGTPAALWTGSLSLGTIFLTGNTETITFSTSLALERKSVDWIWGLKAAGAYGQTRAATTNLDQVTALNGLFALRGDRRFGPVVSVYLQGSVSSDHISSIELRPLGELGASLIWFDVKEGALAKTSLRTDLGFVYGREFRFQYYPTPVNSPDVDLIAPHFGMAYKYAISKDISFGDDFDLTANMVDAVRIIATNAAKLSARLTASAALNIGFNVAVDSEPAAGKKKIDTATLISVEIAL
jgi:hypothetical protein